MSPHHVMPVSASSPIDEQIRYLEDFLKELEPDTPPAPISQDSERVTDLRQAKTHIDAAIALLRPHFSGPSTG